MVGPKLKRDEARYRRSGELSEANPTVSIAVKDVHREVPSYGYRPRSSTDDPLKGWDFSNQNQCPQTVLRSRAAFDGQSYFRYSGSSPLNGFLSCLPERINLCILTRVEVDKIFT